MSIAPLNAQGGNHAIAGTSADGEDLMVTVTWRDSVTAGGFEIAVFDDNDLQIAGQLVWPIPGEQTQTTFDELLHNVPESGFQFSATVRDSAGRDVVQPHAFRVVIECPHPMEPCQWRTQDGLYTNALATSESLLAALDVLEAKGSSDLLADALEEPPDLRGPVFSLAVQIDRLDQHLDLGNECFCAWYHYPGHDPNEPERDYIDQQFLDGYGNEQAEVRGIGASAAVAGQARFSPTPHLATATGMSRQTMGLDCWKIHDWIEGVRLPLLPAPGIPPRTIRFPKFEACPDSCRGTVESSATVEYGLSTRVHDPKSDANSFACAAVDIFFGRDDGVGPPPAPENWPVNLPCVSVDTDSKDWGTIKIPTEEPFVDSNIREITTTLSGEVTAEWQSIDIEALSHAMAKFNGTLLQAKGYADCAIQTTGEGELRASDDGTLGGGGSVDCGEPLIDPWVP